MKKNKAVIILVILLVLILIGIGMVIVPSVVEFYIGKNVWHKTLKLGAEYSDEITEVSEKISVIFKDNENAKIDDVLEQVKNENPEAYNVVFGEMECIVMTERIPLYEGEVELQRCYDANNNYIYGYLYFPEKIEEYHKFPYYTEKITDNLYAYSFYFI